MPASFTNASNWVFVKNRTSPEAPASVDAIAILGVSSWLAVDWAAAAAAGIATKD